MSRPVTLMTCQWGDLSLEELCKLAKQMGYDGLELAWTHFDIKKAASLKLKELIDVLGLLLIWISLL